METNEKRAVQERGKLHNLKIVTLVVCGVCLFGWLVGCFVVVAFVTLLVSSRSK